MTISEAADKKKFVHDHLQTGEQTRESQATAFELRTKISSSSIIRSAKMSIFPDNPSIGCNSQTTTFLPDGSDENLARLVWESNFRTLRRRRKMPLLNINALRSSSDQHLHIDAELLHPQQSKRVRVYGQWRDRTRAVHHVHLETNTFDQKVLMCSIEQSYDSSTHIPPIKNATENPRQSVKS